MATKRRLVPASGLVGAFQRFVGVAVRLQTYRNLAYLLLAFPFGLFYFLVLTIGFSVSGGLLVVAVGVPLLLLVLYLARWLVLLERRVTEVVLGVEVPGSRPSPLGDGVPADAAGAGSRLSVEYAVAWVKALVTDRGTWTGVVYLGSKFVIGLFAFVLVLTLLSTTATFLATPLFFRTTRVGIVVGEPVRFTLEFLFEQWGWQTGLSVPVVLTDWQVTTIADALVFSAIGAVIGLVSLHVCNGLARLSGWYARVMLRGRATAA